MLGTQNPEKHSGNAAWMQSWLVRSFSLDVVLDLLLPVGHSVRWKAQKQAASWGLHGPSRTKMCPCFGRPMLQETLDLPTTSEDPSCALAIS